MDYAVVPSEKVSPSITKFTAIGVLFGIVLACAIIVLKEMLDTQIRSEDYLIQTYKLPVLAVIPDLLGSNKSDYYTAYDSSSPAKKG